MFIKRSIRFVRAYGLYANIYAANSFKKMNNFDKF